MTVVRDPELAKPDLIEDPPGSKAKEFHGEMRFVRLVKDGLSHSGALAIVADKNYCAGGERSCKKILDM